MSFGLLVKNQDGAAQIDATYIEMGIKSFGTLIPTSSGNMYLSGVNSQDNNPTQGFPVVLLKPSPYGVWRMPYVGEVYGQGSNVAVIQSGFNQPVKYVLLDLTDSPLSIPSGSNWGIRVFNASGLTVFDSRKRRFFLDQIAYITLPDNFYTYDFSMPPPEFGDRYFQAIVRGRGGEYGEDPGVIIYELSANNYRIEARRQYWEDPGAGTFVISGFFKDT